MENISSEGRWLEVRYGAVIASALQEEIRKAEKEDVAYFKQNGQAASGFKRAA